MTESEKRMRSVLTGTGLYSGEDKIFAAELSAYGAGLELLRTAAERAGRNRFIATADADGLAAFESLFRLVPSSDSIENRRAMLLERGGVTPADHTKSALERQLLAAGIRGTITQAVDGGLNVNVLEVLGISETAAEREARAFLPAHLPCTFDFGANTWNAVDAGSLTFDAMDGKNYTWDQIDAM